MNTAELTLLKLDVLKFLERRPVYESYSTGQLVWLLNEEKQDPIVQDDADSRYSEYGKWKDSVRLALWFLRKEEKVDFHKKGFRNAFYYSRKVNAYSSAKSQ